MQPQGPLAVLSSQALRRDKPSLTQQAFNPLGYNEENKIFWLSWCFLQHSSLPVLSPFGCPPSLGEGVLLPFLFPPSSHSFNKYLPSIYSAGQCRKS